jgi:predicted RNA-binding protein associated with RNAse of E/G family
LKNSKKFVAQAVEKFGRIDILINNAGRAMKIIEIKRHLNKPDESYLCDLLKRGKDFIIIKYVNEQPGSVGSVMFDTGSTTYAYYGNGMGYVVWKMVNPHNLLKGYLFHVCRDLQVKEDRVEYLDLLLDVWFDPQGQMTILDRDEVQQCTAAGVIGESELLWIAQQEQQIVENWQQIITDFNRLL